MYHDVSWLQLRWVLTIRGPLQNNDIYTTKSSKVHLSVTKDLEASGTLLHLKETSHHEWFKT
jgi:hypothetical protein